MGCLKLCRWKSSYLNANNTSNLQRSLEEAFNAIFEWLRSNLVKSDVCKYHLLWNVKDDVNAIVVMMI